MSGGGGGANVGIPDVQHVNVSLVCSFENKCLGINNN